MARIPIEMPKLGYDMETGTIGSWLKGSARLARRGHRRDRDRQDHGRDGGDRSGTLAEQTQARARKSPWDRHRLHRRRHLSDRRRQPWPTAGHCRTSTRPWPRARNSSRVRELSAADRPRLPLRFWRQQAHFTTPAERDIAIKAMTGGTTPWAASWSDSGSAPASSPTAWASMPAPCERLLDTPRAAPLVMVDAEDALAHTDAAAEQARVDAIEVLVGTADEPAGAPDACASSDRRDWAWAPPPASCTRSCGDWSSAAGPDDLPLDGIIFPKVDHPEEVDFVHDHAHERRDATWASRRARSGPPISSNRAGAPASWTADRRSVRPIGCARSSSAWRTTAPTWGCRPSPTDHPVADWARAHIVNVAAGVGVPAIDGMTLAYPVADPLARRGRQPGAVPGAHGAGLRRRRPCPRLGHAGQVGRPSGPAVRGAAGLRRRVQRRGPGARRPHKLAAYTDSVHARRQGRDDDRRRDVRSGHRPACTGRCCDRPPPWDTSMLDRALALGVIDEREIAEARRLQHPAREATDGRTTGRSVGWEGRFLEDFRVGDRLSPRPRAAPSARPTTPGSRCSPTTPTTSTTTPTTRRARSSAGRWW